MIWQFGTVQYSLKFLLDANLKDMEICLREGRQPSEKGASLSKRSLTVNSFWTSFLHDSFERLFYHYPSFFLPGR